MKIDYFTKNFEGSFSSDSGKLKSFSLESNGKDVCDLPISLAIQIKQEVENENRLFPDLDSSRLRELLEDYIRDSKTIGRDLGIPDDEMLIHRRQRRAIFDLQSENKHLKDQLASLSIITAKEKHAIADKLSKAIDFIKSLNSKKRWHGKQYRQSCGQWLAKHLDTNGKQPE